MLKTHSLLFSETTKDRLNQGGHLDPDAPVEIRIIPKSHKGAKTIASSNEIHLSHSNADVSLHASAANPSSSQTNQNEVYLHSHGILDIHKDTNKDYGAIHIDSSADNRAVNVINGGSANKDNGIPVSDNEVVLNNTPQSIKVVSLDGTENAQALESDNFQTSELRKPEKLQNLVPNPLPEYSTSVTEGCSEFSCRNGGTCVDDGTTYRNIIRCDCPLGTHGQLCEKGKSLL